MTAMTAIICWYLRKRYGGNVHALKPPIGYHTRYSPKPLRWITIYKIRYVVWLAENKLFVKYGEQIRKAWLRS